MLVSKSESECFVKIVDFGLAQFNHISLKAGAGTPIYMAPEIVSSKTYNEKVDIWSLGVMTYLLISGKPPFMGKDRDELFRAIKRGEVQFEGKEWENVSSDCQDFISQCLRVDQQRRPSAQFLLNTPWIKKYADSSLLRYEEEKSLVNDLKRFSGATLLHHAVFNYISLAMISAKEQKKFYQYFKKLDKDNDGAITRHELEKGIDKLFSSDFRKTKDISQIIESLDQNQDGRIEYTEFMAGLIRLHESITDEQLKRAFDYFDADNSGAINFENFSHTLVSADHVELEQAWERILNEMDKNKDKKIQFSELKAAIQKHKS